YSELLYASLILLNNSGILHSYIFTKGINLFNVILAFSVACFTTGESRLLKTINDNNILISTSINFLFLSFSPISPVLLASLFNSFATLTGLTKQGAFIPRTGINFLASIPSSPYKNDIILPF